MAGTLIILITSLFMNAGAIMDISSQNKNENMSNQIVMNSIISSASAGLYVVLQTQWNNIVRREDMIKEG